MLAFIFTEIQPGAADFNAPLCRMTHICCYCTGLMVLMIFLWESLRYASLRAPPDNARMRISYQLPQYVFYVFFDPTVSSQVDLSIFYALIQVRVAGGTASKKGNPDAPLLRDIHWLLRWIPKAFPGQLRDIISPVCPGVSSKMAMS